MNVQLRRPADLDTQQATNGETDLSCSASATVDAIRTAVRWTTLGILCLLLSVVSLPLLALAGPVALLLLAIYLMTPEPGEPD